jgi:hypothetical protein
MIYVHLLIWIGFGLIRYGTKHVVYSSFFYRPLKMSRMITASKRQTQKISDLKRRGERKRFQTHSSSFCCFYNIGTVTYYAIQYNLWCIVFLLFQRSRFKFRFLVWRMLIKNCAFINSWLHCLLLYRLLIIKFSYTFAFVT